MIEAVIFDMDGVIINSEPFWVDAEFETYNKYGINISREMCMQMKGVQTADAVKHWFSKYNWSEPTIEDLTSEIIDKVCLIIDEKGSAMPGLHGLLEYLQDNKIKIGLATSSTSMVIEVVMNKLKIARYFDAIHSAEFEKRGKPFPDVYLGAAKKLRVVPENCIAIEDSIIGLQSAKAAGMFCIALPEMAEYKNVEYDIADVKIKSLKEFIDLDYKGKLILARSLKLDE